LFSGAPGYLKGSPILIGDIDTFTQTLENGSTESGETMKYNLSGFPLRGADQKGRCYYVKD
jgi:hypothetical protein